MSTSFDIQTCRDRFPALKQKQVFFDNAGGSQVLGDVAKAVSDYLLTTNVQLGASYNIGKKSTASYTEGCKAAAKYINADDDEVVLGPSTTQLFRNLSYALQTSPGDEIVVSQLDHEANIAPWVDLASRHSLTLKWWRPSTSTTNPQLTPSNLAPLLSSKTRLVTCTHASNVLGTIHDIKGITSLVHEKCPGAMVCVDAVAFAPHRRVDVRELGVDFYSFSWYKVYGPHVAMLYARREAQKELKSLGHYFNPTDTLENKLGLAAANYELVQSIPVIVEYLGGSNPKPVSDAIVEQEAKLQKILLDYLNGKKGVTIIGEPSADPALRVSTISFVVDGMDSQKLVETVESKSDFGFRWGHFYSERLVKGFLDLGKSGVVRVSMVHYNTEEEISEFVKVLDSVLP